MRVHCTPFCGRATRGHLLDARRSYIICTHTRNTRAQTPQLRFSRGSSYRCTENGILFAFLHWAQLFSSMFSNISKFSPYVLPRCQTVIPKSLFMIHSTNLCCHKIFYTNGKVSFLKSSGAHILTPALHEKCPPGTYFMLFKFHV